MPRPRKLPVDNGTPESRAAALVAFKKSLPKPDLRPMPVPCISCEKLLPVEAFPGFPRGQQICKYCMAQEQVDLAEAALVEKANQAMGRVFDAANIHKVDLPRIDFMLSEFYRHMGGPEQAMVKMHEHFKIAMDKHPGSKWVVDAFRAILKLHVETTKLQVREDIAFMEDERLREQRDQAIAKLLIEAAQDKARASIIAGVIRAAGLKAEQFNLPKETIEALEHDSAADGQS